MVLAFFWYENDDCFFPVCGFVSKSDCSIEEVDNVLLEFLSGPFVADCGDVVRSCGFVSVCGS